tara:strand:+ start:450 stop:860 length:411 start_codon:yes stop_codon:yes gene_type:complete
MITKGIKELCQEAENEIETLAVNDVMLLSEHEDIQLIDIRDIRELWRDGTIPGSIHAPRGMLEFWVDPASPYYKEIFGSGKKFIFYCAGGMRSALAAHTVHRMGLTPVAHMSDGYAEWVKAGGATESKKPKTNRQE